MAMKPFCGYNFADYWSHWLSFGERLTNLPKVFHVNWFRQNANGDFLWPGFGENLRVLSWIIDRCENRVGANETPIGYLPKPQDINVTDLDISDENLQALTSIDIGQWQAEMESVGEYLDTYGDRLPEALRQQQRSILEALS
jgi:phosphoenolpyruvate carboxykinase (GTP)